MLIAPDRLWTNGALTPAMAIEIAGGQVARLRPLGRDTPDLRPALVIPGAADLQVNGAGGVMLNSDPSPGAMRAIAAAMRGRGSCDVLPTLITDAPEALEAAADAAIATRGEAGIAGLHIEGPHISIAKRGTHDPRFIRPLDQPTLDCVARLRQAGVPVLITLAPEATAPGQIAALVGMGAVVSIGHSAASPDEMRRALAEGAAKGTHLFNGMTGLAGRDPGVAGVLLDSDAALGLIADGHHVSDVMIRLAWRAARGPIVLVSDAMPTVGGPDHFTLYGQEIHVQGGKLVNAEGSLAGVHMALAEALPRVTRILGDDGTQALAAATHAPAALMRLDGFGHLRPGATGGVTLFDNDLRWLE